MGIDVAVVADVVDVADVVALGVDTHHHYYYLQRNDYIYEAQL